MAHEIFISYAAEDKAIADAVCQAIEAAGLTCWYAPRDVGYGQDFEESIVDAIGVSRLLILILTSHSNDSAHVKREIQNACLEEVGVPVLPFRIEDIPLNKALQYYVGSVHWLDAVTPPLETHLQRLVEHVRERLPRDVSGEKKAASSPTETTKSRAPVPVTIKTEATTGKEKIRGRSSARRKAPARASRPWALLAVPAVAVFLVLLVIGAAVVGLYLYGRTRPTSNTFTFQTVQLDMTGKVIARKSGTAKYFTEDLSNGVTLDMVQIPAGKFLMGSPESESMDTTPILNGPKITEQPQHEVTVPAFFVGKYEVTQEQWRAVARLPKVKIDLDAAQSHWRGDKLPVDSVEWVQAEEFCARLSKKTGHIYRLPSEAEWEYACRAGTTTPFAFGDTITMDIANYNGVPYAAAAPQADRNTTLAVGSLSVANAFGLYDMHGNVAEWVLDPPHVSYEGAPTDGTAWYGNSVGSGTNPRIIRGGGLSKATFSRCGHRDQLCEDCATFTIGLYFRGFRVVAVAQSH
jgi:formylglycine-generating enzyme required for sulfatase activity